MCLHVADMLCVGEKEFYENAVASIKMDYQIRSEDINNVLFVGQGVCWKTEDQDLFIQVDQGRSIELGENEFDNSLLDSVCCSAALHYQYRSVLGPVNWLQSRTQYKACYRFSRCASAAAGPTVADVRALSKLVRSIRSEPCVLKYWPLKWKTEFSRLPRCSLPEQRRQQFPKRPSDLLG